MNYFSFANSSFDRQSHRRDNAEELEKERLQKSRTIVFKSQKFLISPDTNRISWLDELELERQLKMTDITERPTLAFLGKDTTLETAYWAMDIDSTSNKPLLDLYNTAKFVDPRPACFELSAFESSIFALASSVLDFNRRIKFCAGCGAKTLTADSGWKRLCSNKECESHTKTENYSYIRTDAVAIVNVVSPDGTKVLLGRQKTWPPKRYSCVAGFMEPGESIEEAAQREVLEETGVEVEDIRYHSSQPWPFPSQIMLGVQARARAMTIDISSRDKELEDAKWFSREDVLEALNDKNPDLRLPPSYAIAHTLIKSWALQSSRSTGTKL